MKSITPVISIILLILLTIIASVSAYMFIMSSMADLEGGVNTNTAISDNSKLKIVSLSGSKAIVMNEGSGSINEVIVMLNGEPFSYTFDPPIIEGGAAEILFSPQLVGEDLEIKILYGINKEVDYFSPSEKNTEDSGFIQETLPIVLSASIVKNTTQLLGYCQASVYNILVESVYYYEWILNSGINASGNVIGNHDNENYLLNNITFSEGVWKFRCMISDGVENSSWKESQEYITTEPDNLALGCSFNNSNNVWFTGNIIGTNYYCCGDDIEEDDFYNSTNYCCNGILDSGNCFCGDDTCQAWENNASCSQDCSLLIINNVSIFAFSEGLKGYCNASSTKSTDLLRYNYSWIKNDIIQLTNFDFIAKSIDAGSAHSCGLLTNGSIMCWGGNNQGQLGDGTLDGKIIPVFVDSEYIFESIGAGVIHSCGILNNGSALCWGTNSVGQLGSGVTGGSSSLPVFVAGNHEFKMIDIGGSHNCGVLINGSAMCWGFNEYGFLGDGTNTARNTPVYVTGGYIFKSVSAGRYHSCGVLVNGSAMCWGYNSWGNLGNNLTSTSYSPVFVSGDYIFSSIDLGFHHTCGVLVNGSAVCWGDNANGRLGDNTTDQRIVPTFVYGEYEFLQVSSGTDGSHTCGVLTNGSAVCWGLGSSGQLGQGSTLSSNIPVFVDGNYKFARVGAGYHTCGVLVNGSAVCWGVNNNGRLGDGSTIQKTTPSFCSTAEIFKKNFNYWNQDLLISILPNDFYNSLEQWEFTCNIMNDASISDAKNFTFNIP